MKRALAAVAMCLAANAAFAQSMAPAVPTAGPGARASMPGGAALSPQAAMRRMPGLRRTAADMDLPPPPPASKGAHFNFRNGMMAFDVTCGEASSVKDCAEAATGLVERLGAASAMPTAAVSPPPAEGQAAPAE